MRRYTKHLQTILQTQNTCKTQKIQPTPHQNNGAWKEERCSRPLYSSHTTHPHHNNHTPTSAQSSTVQANKTTTTTPTRCGLLCAAPDTQQHANTLKNNVCGNSHDPGLLRSASVTAGAHPPGFQNTFRWQSHTRRHQPPHVPQPWAQNKSSLERR